MLLPPLDQEIKTALEVIYGADQVQPMYAKIQAIAEQARADRPTALCAEDEDRAADWYKEEVIYMFYPDQFGVKERGTFRDLLGMLDYLQLLGVTTLYILPFMDSPMGDAGFDVRDPQAVRQELGGLVAFEAFAAAARERGFKIKADLILNHFSDQHPWFQAALQGDVRMLDRFVTRRTPPTSRKYVDPQRGVVVDYEEEDGRVSSRRLIFPEMSKDHWRHVRIGGEDYYLYHTFYPFQLDVNWENPEVLYYVLETIGFWANRGVDIFRMDAIPYFIKEPGTPGENLPRTHRVVKLLSAFLQAVAPRSVIQAEACQWPKDILPYFGQEREILVDSRQLVRTDEVQIAYNFPYMPAIWASLITGEANHFWKAFHETPTIPPSAAWAIFLRVHDELTLEMVDLETRAILYERLLPKGAEFRKGLGVAGRLADFLDRDPRKIEQAFAIMLSLPGLPTVYYGDEIGATNNWDYAKKAEAERQELQAGEEMLSYFDSRDINRGPIPKEAFEQAEGSPLWERIRQLIRLRRETRALTRGGIVPVQSDLPNLFAYLRGGEDILLILHNLSDEPCRGILLIPPEVALPEGPWTDRISGQPVTLEAEGEGLALELAPRQSVWLQSLARRL